MNECFRCGISGDRVKLHTAISNTGIVKVCDDCASIEKLPTINKPTEAQLTAPQRKVSVRDRLTGMSKSRIIGREVTLRDIVDRDFKAKKIQPLPDLVDNFHWTIQRIKRARKITREQFAKGIGESEATVRMIEQGFLPENNYKIISKIENYLGISLRKPGASGFPETSKEPPRRFSLDDSAVKQLKIADLKEMKQQPEKDPVDTWEEEYSQDDEKFLDEEMDFDEEKD